MDDRALQKIRKELLREEAEASVLLDLESGVHTCYDGHDCKADAKRKKAEAKRIRARQRARKDGLNAG